MAISSITEWLRSPVKNFHQGRIIYEQYGQDKLILTIIQSGSGSYHLSKLIEGMQAVNLQKDLTPKKIVIPDLILEAPSPGKVKTNLEYAPAEIQDIRNKKNLAYAQARRLHETIRVMDDPAHRLEASLQLLDSMDFVQECWTIMDQWAQSGQITALQEKEAAAKVEALTLQQLLQEQKNLPSYICKFRQRYEKATDPRKKAKCLAGLQEKTIRLEQIKIKITELIK